MCLETKSKSRIAVGDIVCYKALSYSNIDSDALVTPFMRTPVNKRILSGKCLFHAKGKQRILPASYAPGNYGVQVDKGFIHVWKDAEFAMKIHKGPIFKCIIPEGTRYYDGRFNGWIGYDSMCAEKIRFVERIK